MSVTKEDLLRLQHDLGIPSLTVFVEQSIRDGGGDDHHVHLFCKKIVAGIEDTENIPPVVLDFYHKKRGE